MVKSRNIILALILVVPTLLNGCGSASNNDQGTSFTAVGYFEDSTGTTGSSGQIVVLSNSGNGVITAIQLQNRLAGQFIRVTRLDCDYSIPGSAVPIPSDSFNVGSVIEAAAVTRNPTTGEILTLEPSSGTLEFTIVSTDLIDFIIANIGSMPPLPFRMNASCSATGVTQSGDVLVTNSLGYFVQFN
jgi:hypothetical protein